MTRSIDGIRAFVASNLWAVLPEYLDAMLDVLQLRASGTMLAEAEIARRIAGADHGALGGALGAAAVPPPRPISPSAGMIAVLPLHGLIAPRASMVNNMSGPGGTSTEAFGQAFDAAMANPAVSAIVIDVDSPGGMVNGVPELAGKIADARGTKRIVAVANGQMASAAYYIGSAADEIAAAPSGEVGSIGVYTVHNDLSGALSQEGVKQTLIKAGKYKAEGHPSQPLDDAAREAIQSRVNEAYDMFVGSVAKNRGVPVADVRNGYGEGRVVSAKQAVSFGMADRVATLDDVISRLASSKGGPKPGSGRRADTMRRRLALEESLDACRSDV